MNRLFLLGIVIAVLLGAMGYQGFAVLRQKAQQQSDATEVIRRWKQSYRALASSTGMWSKRYTDLGGYKDLLDLYRGLGLERYNLVSDPDALAITRLETVQYNGADLGLVRVCLASSGAASDAGFTVNAASYQDLLGGVTRLAQRPDVEIAGIGVKGADETPTASLTGFCVLVRQEVRA